MLCERSGIRPKYNWHKWSLDFHVPFVDPTDARLIAAPLALQIDRNDGLVRS
jgi:hypothetical protein